MMGVSVPHSCRLQYGRGRILVGLPALTGALVGLIASPAFAVGPGNYQMTISTNGAFTLFTANNLLTGTTDDAVFQLSTTATGPAHLPFPLTFYNQTYKVVAVSSNGNLQFTSANLATAAYSNDCLPSGTFAAAVAAPFWDDLYFVPSDTSHFFREGIFTKTKGAKPHRTFTISWQGHFFNSETNFALAQIVFHEGTQNPTFVYGADGMPPEATLTVGVQAPGGATAHSTQWTCNGAGLGQGVQAGLKLTFKHH